MKNLLTSFLISLIPTLILAQDVPLWGEPEPVMFWDYDINLCHLGADVSFISEDGQHLFVRWEDGGIYWNNVDTCFGSCDFYVLHRMSSEVWGQPKNLGRNINNEYNVDGISLSPDLREIYFCQWNPDIGYWDLFRSTRDDISCDTCWEPAEPFPDSILGTTFAMYFPMMSRDGLILYLEAGCDPFAIERDSIGGFWRRSDTLVWPDWPPGCLTLGGFALTADNNECFWTNGARDICYRKRTDGVWWEVYVFGPPLNIHEPIEYNSKFPRISADGNDLFYKRDLVGLMVSHRINRIVEIEPMDYLIYVYPNPFNSACAITALAGAEIGIYDLRGRLVNKSSVFDFVESTSLIKGDTDETPAPIEQCGKAEESPLIREMSEGQRVYVWQPDETIFSGIYLVRARTEDGRTASKRVVYLR